MIVKVLSGGLTDKEGTYHKQGAEIDARLLGKDLDWAVNNGLIGVVTLDAPTTRSSGQPDSSAKVDESAAAETISSDTTEDPNTGAFGQLKSTIKRSRK